MRILDAVLAAALDWESEFVALLLEAHQALRSRPFRILRCRQGVGRVHEKGHQKGRKHRSEQL